jgi:hypothetical protein
MKPFISLLLIIGCINLSAQKHKNEYNPYQRSTKIDWESTLLRSGSWILITGSCYCIGKGILEKNKPFLFSGVGSFAFAIGYDFTIEWNLKKKKK